MLTGRMSTREALETIVEDRRVCLRANGPRLKLVPQWHGSSEPADRIRRQIYQVGLATANQVGSGLAKQVLHSLCEEERSGNRKSKTHEGGVELP